MAVFSVKSVMERKVQAGKRLLRSGGKKAASVGKAIRNAELPQSLEWIFGFGFKAGIFLLLKSFFIIKYQYANLNETGYCVIMSQVSQALVLVGCGMLMQNRGLYDDSCRLHRITRYYGYAFLLGVLIFVLRGTLDWQFFKQAASVNWFKDFFSSLSKGAGEISLSLLFWDFDLWAMFCGLLYFVVKLYLRVIFPPAQTIFQKTIDGFYAMLNHKGMCGAKRALGNEAAQIESVSIEKLPPPAKEMRSTTAVSEREGG